MNNIFSTAVRSFADACALGTDFHRENCTHLYAEK